MIRISLTDKAAFDLLLTITGMFDREDIEAGDDNTGDRLNDVAMRIAKQYGVSWPLGSEARGGASE